MCVTMTQVWLVQPGLWKTIWSYALGPAEDALCIKALTLKNSQKGEFLEGAVRQHDYLLQLSIFKSLMTGF